MPHAVLPAPGFQAIILCGPGASFSTFTSSPDEIPKAMLPIANRPMLWYPLEWCYRMGVTGEREEIWQARLSTADSCRNHHRNTARVARSH